MITALQAADALQTCVVAILGITILFKILPMLRLDCFRQNMFAIRDELFDYAAEGNISFSDPAYVLLRRQMNGMIRYGHQLTVFRVLVTSVMRSISGQRQAFLWHDSWEEALEKLGSAEVREKLRYFHNRSASVAAKHLVTGSVVMWVALLGTALYLLARGAAMGATQLTYTAAKTILSTGPMNQKSIEEDAVGALA